MLLLNATTITKTSSSAMVPAANITEEGLALVYTRINGELAVQPSTGVTGEEFAGFAIARQTPPATLPHVETGIIPVGGAVLLARLPIAGQILVKVDGEVATLSAAGTQPADAGGAGPARPAGPVPVTLHHRTQGGLLPPAAGSHP